MRFGGISECGGILHKLTVRCMDSEKGRKSRVLIRLGLLFGYAGITLSLLALYLKELRTLTALVGKETLQLRLYLFCIDYFSVLLWAAGGYLVYRISSAISPDWQKGSEKKQYYVRMLMSAGLIWFFCVIALSASFLFVPKNQQKDYMSAAAGSAEIVQKLTAGSSKGRYQVFVDDIPTVYDRISDGFSFSFRRGNGHGNEKNAVIITGLDEEYYNLIENAGFEFGILNSREGIYTNSAAALNLLKNQGIDMRPVYYRRESIDLAAEARKRGFEVQEDGSAVLRGETQTFRTVLGRTVHPGTMEVTFRLRLKKADPESDVVALLKLSAEKDTVQLDDFRITKEMFEDRLEMKIVRTVSVTILDHFAITVQPSGGSELEIVEISYGKI